MSINAQTNAVILKRQKLPAPRRRSSGAPAAPLPAGPDLPSTTVSQALQALSTYIPGEVITLYLLAVAAWQSIKAALGLGNDVLYWAFVALTPVFWLLVYWAKVRSLPPGNLTPMPWPLAIWYIFASTVAFAAWALALAPRPYLQGEDAVVALIVVGVSIFLSLIGQIVSRGQRIELALN